MHFQRWLTAIVAIPILIYLIGFGQRWIFYSLLYLVSLAGLKEFYSLTTPGLPKFIRFSSYILTLLLFIVIYKGEVLFALIVITLWAIIPMIFFLFNGHPTGAQNTSDIGKAVMGPIYVTLPLAMLLPIDRFYLINYPVKGVWIFFLLAVIFANDTGAFYCGRLLGKHRLYESISPKKTWEGAIGGLFGSIIIAFLFLRILNPHPINLRIIALVLVLSVMGQIGDLSESMLKRNHGVKDSGKILPGHGGILDRIDSLLFSIPVLYLFLVWSMP